MRQLRRIELLAPAKTSEIGMEAVLHGADAIYIGGPAFGARSAAPNSVDDIARLVDFAHMYDTRVYVALNTILYDKELRSVEKLVSQLYSVGVDALIVQDMGVLHLDIPPIALHASTQCDNRTIEKVKFLHDAGFSRVVLARELSERQIRDISAAVPVELEAFVHGALCVCYSGQCYLSQALSGRSANRGECAQFCRLPYNLLDAEGNVLIKDKHLLSLKDMNRSERVEQLLDAGVTSLKIEGRLKDMTYVKNVVAYYRRILDDIYHRRPEFCSLSSGRSEYTFIPDMMKSFNRGFTRYFIDGKPDENMGSPYTPKSLGEPIGKVVAMRGNAFVVDGDHKLSNGDGFCFLTQKDTFGGFRANKIDGRTIYPAERINLSVGTMLYRNYDKAFEQLLTKKSAERRISIDMCLYEIPDGCALKITDDAANKVVLSRRFEKQIARTPQFDNIRAQLTRIGDTCFEVERVDINFDNNLFVPSSLLSSLRRDAVAEFLMVRRLSYRPSHRKNAESPVFPHTSLTYLGNVSNAAARNFYTSHGVHHVAPAYECAPVAKVPLMFTRFCIKRQWGQCKKYRSGGNSGSKSWKEPLFLQYRDKMLRLEFDCSRCEMRVYKEE